MTNKKTSALPAASLPLAGDELVPGVQNGANVSIPASALASGSAPAWGDVTGKPAVITGTTAAFTTAQETKLANIATAATANASDAALRDRSTHTGTQAISTVTGLQTALDGKAAPSLYIQETRPSATGPWTWWQTDALGNVVDLILNDGTP